MALVDLQSIVDYPHWPNNFYNVNNPGNTQDITTANDYHAVAFYAPKTGSIEQVHIQIGALINAQDLHVSIQDADSEFKPDGTVDQFVVLASGSLSANTLIATGPITSDGTGGGTRRSVTKGDKLTVVFRFNSTVGDVDFISGHAPGAAGMIPNTWISSNAGSTWSSKDHLPNFAIEYVTDGIVYAPNMFPLQASTTSASFNTGTTPDEAAMKFQLPFTGRCVGAYVWGNVTTQLEYSIETAGKTVVAGPDVVHADTSATPQMRYVQWATPVTLTIDTDYYLIWTPNTVTSKTHRYFTINAAAIRAALPSGLTSSYNTRTDDGAWSEDTVKTLPFSLVFDQLDDGAGGGGGSCTLVNGTAVIPATCPV
jgi:hypothetical protein